MLIKDAEREVLSGLPEPTRLSARATTFRALFTKQYRGVRVADIVSDLHLPALRHLSDDVVRAAGIFDRDMRRQGFEPLQPPEGLVLFGPYEHRDLSVFRSDGKKAAGRMDGETADNESADFILQGVFIAPRGHMLPKGRE